MRLLNAATLHLEAVIPGSKPKYVALSHRWKEGEEVSFRDIHTDHAKTKGGFTKIKACCETALREGFSHVWIDTCCIDQSSSAELSEAINSMFRWYREAEICYVYLHDATNVQDFVDSEWFDRGWTLQELVAPAQVRLYSKDWEVIGTKSTLSHEISLKSGISKRFLLGEDLELASIAERMSWAAKRKTTREEDASYCLLGIFDIQMPLLYGEGAKKAFFRLQSQIIRESHDQSWLAWSTFPGYTDSQSNSVLRGMLAESPAYFWNCRDVISFTPGSVDSRVNETNLGIDITLPVIKKRSLQYALICCRWRHDFSNVIAIPLIEQDGQYFRGSLDTDVSPENTWVRAKKRAVILSRRARKLRSCLEEHDHYYIWADDSGFAGILDSLEVFEVFPADAWDPSSNLIRSGEAGHGGTGSVRLVRLQSSTLGPPPRIQDYILMLSYKTISGIQHPTCELGKIADDCNLCDVMDSSSAMIWSDRVELSGSQKWLLADLTKRHRFRRPTFIIELYAKPIRSQEEVARAQAIVIFLIPWIFMVMICLVFPYPSTDTTARYLALAFPAYPIAFITLSYLILKYPRYFG
jgi:hypothetical protein